MKVEVEGNTVKMRGKMYENKLSRTGKSLIIHINETPGCDEFSFYYTCDGLECSCLSRIFMYKDHIVIGGKVERHG